MKKLLALSALVLSPLAFSNMYHLDPTHTTIGFEVSHLGITKVPGKFKEFTGTFEFDEKTQMIKNMKVDIKTASIDTGNTDRDKHLVGADFFNSAKKGHEVATFVVKGPVKITDKAVDGKLTLNNKTHTVPLMIKFNGMANFMGMNKAAFDATTKIDRTKFGMTWNKPIENVQRPGMVENAANKAKEWAVGNEVTINIHVEADQKAATQDKKLASQQQ